MKLISMTDFVLEQSKKDLSAETTANNCISYAQFLKQPLKLEMFVPCDNGNVLNDPGLIPSYELEQYRKAKEKVLFEGFTLEGNIIYLEGWYFCKTNEIAGSNIEWILFNIEEFDEIKLTQNATKQFL